jgi:hypothetical protein
MGKFIPLLFTSKSESYINKIKRIFGANLVAYYPMNEASGTTVVDHSIYARNATYTGVTKGQPGIGDGNTSALFSGGTDVVTLPAYWQGANVFPKNEGSMMVWAKISQADWIGGEYTYMIYFSNEGGGFYRIAKWGDAWKVMFTAMVNAGKGYMDMDWIHLAMTWSVIANETNYYINGHSVGTGAAPTGFGTYTWVNQFGRVFKGYLAHAILLDRPATPSEVNLAARNMTVPKTITIIGDSISVTNPPTYPTWLYYEYNRGNNTLYNRAVGGHTIVTNFVSDCATASGDDADIIICLMGTNDNNAGNMSVLQAELEEGLADLKTTNPDAAIYYMNVLPCFDGGGTPLDKSNIRAAVAAGCAAQGVTCWDTFTDPWVEFADTAGGTHLTAAGQEKVFLRVFPLVL